MFFVIIYSAIYQGYIGLSLASCHKDEIWCEQNGTYMGPFQDFCLNWDQVPNLGHHCKHCSCYLDFFFSETKFSETENETFFRPNFLKPRLFCRDQILWNWNPKKMAKSFGTKLCISSIKNGYIDSVPCGKIPRLWRRLFFVCEETYLSPFSRIWMTSYDPKWNLNPYWSNFYSI